MRVWGYGCYGCFFWLTVQWGLDKLRGFCFWCSVFWVFVGVLFSVFGFLVNSCIICYGDDGV